MTDEYQYLNLLERIVRDGDERVDRVVADDPTMGKTRCVFGAQMRFNLRDNVFPLLTTKRVYWKGVVEELMWFLRGSTNVKDLNDKGVKIWDANAKAFDADGDLGPIYGYQWRNFGGDQITRIIKTLQTNPHDRRMILTAWNPIDIPKMALPPCHCFAQFDVDSNRRLSCQMYQRSADMGLGVPFNIASYALLTRLMCHVASTPDAPLYPGEFIHTIGNAHVYANHIDAITKQLTRAPRPFPTLEINRTCKIDEYNFDDFSLINYDPHGSLYMPMAL
jgi:thymidylate synthase